MDVNQIAELYVHVIEPGLKVLAFFILVITVLYLFNAMSDTKKKSEFVNNAFGFMMKSVVWLFAGLGHTSFFLVKALLRIFTTLITTVKDFFTSKI